MGSSSRKLFVEKSIDINASPAILWEVLTNSKINSNWIQEWWPEVSLQSKWLKGCPVVWKYSNGEIGAIGDIKFIDPEKVVRFSFTARKEGRCPKEEMTFILHKKKNYTHLTITMGDFADSEEHMNKFSEANDHWKRSLPKIKLLAEKLETDMQ